MNVRVLCGLAAALLLLAACDGRPDRPASPATPAELRDARAVATALDQLLEAHWQATLELDPVRATFVGDHRYNDRYAVLISPTHRAAQRELLESSLAAAEALPVAALDEQRALSHRLFVRALREELEGMDFPEHLLPLNQFRNPVSQFAMLGSGTSAQPFATVQDYENFLGRIQGFVDWVDQAIVNMREGIEAGVVAPAILMRSTLPQLAAHVVDDIEESLFFRPLQAFPEAVPESERTRLRAAFAEAISTRLVPAYARLQDFIRDEYLPQARDSVGLYALPDGESWYEHLVRRYTTTDLGPLEIHAIGLAEVERIHGEMNVIREEVGFDGDLQAFFEYLNTDPKFYFETREQMIEAHEALRAKADAAALELFSRLPIADYEIRPVEEFRERSAAKGSYQRPPADFSRPGIFYVNTWNPQARPRWDTEALFLHEAVPGHHFQRSFNLEIEALPSFRRHGGITAFAEGWGLYAESYPVGRAMGFYQDPYQRFGQLNAELWRAIRLVVDTGLHAKGWSPQQVLDYMYANSATLETRAVSEAERFMAIPGQALAYKIGELQITGLRARAETRLGEAFDIRQFHDVVLWQGDLPLEVLEERVEAWLADR